MPCEGVLDVWEVALGCSWARTDPARANVNIAWLIVFIILFLLKTYLGSDCLVRVGVPFGFLLYHR
jgi:hypothetical protein